MKTRKILLILLAVACVITLFSACTQKTSNKLKDGYYTAERIDFHPTNGWNEYVTIYVRNNKVVTVEYNSKNRSGFIKSWDMKYMYDMRNYDTHPNHYTRDFAAQFLAKYGTDQEVDCIAGATHSYDQFLLLAEAVISKAKAGDKTVALVPYQLYEFKDYPALLEQFDADPELEYHYTRQKR
jgi:major membrane immunogen (membrane-anchored lipoprotein)